MTTRRTRLLRLMLAMLACVVAGAAQLDVAGAVTSALRWGVLRPITSEPTGAEPGEITCSSSRFCVAMWASEGDGFFDDVLVDRDGRWSAPVTLPLDSASLDAVSCTQPTFCFAVDDDGAGLTFDGTKWSSLSAAASGTQNRAMDEFTSDSCASPSFCMAVNTKGDAIAFVNGRWERPIAIDAGHLLTAVSCADGSAPFCMAVDGLGDAVVFEHGRWSKPAQVTSNALTAVACGAVEHCVAVHSLARLFAYDGSWSRANNIDVNGNGIASVSCSTANFCVAVDASERTVTYEDGRWQTPAVHDRTSIGLDLGLPGFTSVSCPTSQFCAAVDIAGNALTYAD